MARRRRAPTIESRIHRCDDGSTTHMWSVRYYRDDGARLRLRCESREEAEFQRARLVYEGVPSPRTSDASNPQSPTSMSLECYWPVWAADARGRLATSTMREYERLWDRRLRPKFGELPLDAIKPRDVAQWRAELLDGGAGPEAVRYAMVLLQAMFAVA